MGKYNGAVITTAGQNVISQAISGTELTWLTMKTSSTAIPAGTNIEALTTLSGIEQTSNITDASVYGNNVIQLSARFSNTNIATEYYIQTVGVYGQLTGGNETLIAVMTAVTPDEMPVYDPDAPSAFIFNTQITVQNAESVTMTVNDTGTATVADLNRKLDKTGDAANAKIGSSTASSASYPIPAANDTFKVILGKIIKFFTDIKAAYTNVSVSGRTVTFTTAAGGTKQITTQDTTYSNMTAATASAAGTHGLVPAPAAGKQGQFLRGDATWATPTNTTYTAGSGLTLSGTQFKHSNAVTAGTAGTSSATSGQDTLAVPYVTYDAQGHVTAAGTHTHTINTFEGCTNEANGKVGLVPQPLIGKVTWYLRADGGWATPQNNLSTTVGGYNLDARMGKTLNDKINNIKIITPIAGTYSSLANNTVRGIASLSLSAGSYLVIGNASTTGTIMSGLLAGTVNTTIDLGNSPMSQAFNGTGASITCMWCYTLSATTSVYMVVRQTSGSAKDILFNLVAVRLS